MGCPGGVISKFHELGWRGVSSPKNKIVEIGLFSPGGRLVAKDCCSPVHCLDHMGVS